MIILGLAISRDFFIKENSPTVMIVHIYLLRFSLSTNQYFFLILPPPLSPTANMTKYEPMNSQDVNSMYSLVNALWFVLEAAVQCTVLNKYLFSQRFIQSQSASASLSVK